MKKTALLILAAGVGSRYGTLKQMDRFGPSGETIIDYSVYDAIRAGFPKVVFVIRKSMKNDFTQYLTSKFQDKIEVQFAFQELDNVPDGIEYSAERSKPWGTGHAILVAKSAIDEPFVVLNADDFYGAGSFKIVYDFLSALGDEPGNQYCIAGYKLFKTLSDHGFVSRGVCETDEKGYLTSVVERLKISKSDGKIVFEDENGQLQEIGGETTVSMNMMGFTPTLFDYLEADFKEFIQEHHHHLKAEFLLPTVINDLVKRNKVKVKVLETDENWFGVTYKEDKEIVIQKIKSLVESGEYPVNLWGK